MSRISKLVFLVVTAYLLVVSIDGRKESDVLNTCIDGMNHKFIPGPEDILHQQVYLFVLYSI